MVCSCMHVYLIQYSGPAFQTVVAIIYIYIYMCVFQSYHLMGVKMEKFV